MSKRPPALHGRASDKRPDPLFVVGDARSGTTYLSNLLTQHRDIGMAPESNCVVHLLRANGVQIISKPTTLDKARLMGEYVEASMTLYRRTRNEAKRLLGQVKEAGYQQVRLNGEGDIAEIAALTCLELSLRALRNSRDTSLPELQVNGTNLELIWNSDPSEDGKP